MEINRAAIVRIKPTIESHVSFDMKRTGNGSGVVIHSNEDNTLILTAAHVIDTAPIYWQQPEVVNSVCKYEITTIEGHSFQARYIATTEYQSPDIGLLSTETTEIGEKLPTLPIARENFLNPGENVKAFGYGANEEFTETSLQFQGLDDKNFENIFLRGVIPTCSSGGPIISNGKIIGIIANGDLRTTHGPSYLALRKMFTNWLEGSYVSHPYNYLAEVKAILLAQRQETALAMKQPAIIQVPEHIREILRNI